MGSLNEIDSLLEKLGGSLDDLSDDDDEDDEEDEEAHKKPPKKAKVTKTKKAPKEEEEEPDEEQYDDDLPPMKKSKKKGPKKETPKSKKKNNNKAREEDEEDEEGEAQKVSQKKKKEAAAGVPQVSEGGAIQSKKNKERGSRNGLCFKYMKGACQFDDCKFLHVNPRKLTNKEQAQMLKELPLRAFDEELAKVVQNMNISKCKDFHQRGQCHRAPGQCHFWHLTSASVARWAGFQFWCETCSKGFTSKDQMDDHCKAAPHQRALAQRKRPSKRKWEWAK